MDNLIKSYEDVIKIADEDFKEEDHPRDNGGQFVSKGGGSSKKSDDEPKELKEKQDTLDKKLDKMSSKKYDQLKNELLDIAWNTMSEDDKNQLLDDIGGDSDGWFPEEGEGTWGFDSYGKSFQDIKDRFYEDGSSRYVEDFVDRLEITSGLYDLFDFEEQKSNMMNEYKFSKDKLKEKEKEYKKAQRVYNSLQKKGGSYAKAGKDLLNKSEWALQKTKNEYEQNIKRLDAIKKLDKKYKTLTRKSSAIEEVYNEVVDIASGKEDGTSDGAKKGWITRKQGSSFDQQKVDNAVKNLTEEEHHENLSLAWNMLSDDQREEIIDIILYKGESPYDISDRERLDYQTPSYDPSVSLNEITDLVDERNIIEKMSWNGWLDLSGKEPEYSMEEFEKQKSEIQEEYDYIKKKIENSKTDDEKYGNMVEMNKVKKRLNAMKKMEDKINSW